LELLQNEERTLNRAGLILLLGECGWRSARVLAALDIAIEGHDELQHHAAAFAVAWLGVQPLSGPARNAIQHALLADELYKCFRGLPWDTGYDTHELREALDKPAQLELAEKLIEKVEKGKAEHQVVDKILQLLFERDSWKRPPLLARELSPLQTRAVRAFAHAAQGEKRIYAGSFPQWGLPETKRAWRDLAAGNEPSPVDPRQPHFAYPEDPQRSIRFDQAKVGDRVLNRQLGLGTITAFTSSEDDFELTVKFDEEGIHEFAFSKDQL
jgi:hypothetical protein